MTSLARSLALRVPVVAGVLLLSALAGCASEVRYLAAPPSRQPTAFVRLEVVDARAPGQGGGDPRAVGTVRGGYGNPMTLRQRDGAAGVEELVRAATADALGRIGVGVRPDAGTRVTARVLRFWMDGYVGYGAHVEVELLADDGAGRVAWGTRAVGDASGVVMTFGGASKLLDAALVNLAQAAAAQLASPAFRFALR